MALDEEVVKQMCYFAMSDQEVGGKVSTVIVIAEGALVTHPDLFGWLLPN